MVTGYTAEHRQITYPRKNVIWDELDGDLIENFLLEYLVFGFGGLNRSQPSLKEIIR